MCLLRLIGVEVILKLNSVDNLVQRLVDALGEEDWDKHRDHFSEPEHCEDVRVVT